MDIEVRARRSSAQKMRIDGIRDGGRFKAPRRTIVEFEGVRFSNVDFSGEHFWSYEVKGSTFTNCDFRRTRFDGGHLGGDEQTVYQHCRFDGAQLGKTDAWFARFEQCVFDSANLDRWRAFNAEFVDCHFAGRVVEVAFAGKPDPKHAKWVRPARAINEFRGNDFRQAELIDCRFFRGVDLDAQLLPQGQDYLRLSRIRARVQTVGVEVASWSDDQARQKALRMLWYIEMTSAEQDDYFARRDDLPIPKEVRDRVWQLLNDA